MTRRTDHDLDRTTTLSELREAGACTERYQHLCTSLGADWGDHEPISLSLIVEYNGVDDAEWALGNCPSLQEIDAAYNAQRDEIKAAYWSRRNDHKAAYDAQPRGTFADYWSRLKEIDAAYDAQRRDIYTDYWWLRRRLKIDFDAQREALLLSLVAEAEGQAA